MRRSARTDDNHAEIALALRRCGCSVLSLAPLGRGAPDLLVGRHGENYLLEIKDGAKRPSARRLTADEIWWHAEWRGQAAIVESVAAALAAVGILNDG